MYIYLYVFFVSIFNSDPDLILGKWKIVELEAIESIRNSDGYLLADFETQSLADQKFQLALDSTTYEFKRDTLYYTDIDGLSIVHRRAIWKLIGDTIFVKEIDRVYLRKYFLRNVNQDSLIFSSIFNGKVAKKRYLFARDEN
ncbi:hypothetical protein PBT90_14185 [Algoriphagus halophytocola]|uniref:Lipocalin-like domain-containing protein n=1 Tax=Algoriphagus halophytocola TaxID=2991499 RepID=A0ABY6MPU3_9BACT|nr:MULTISPECIES: hypothetical protein [unclassified Algoriphagus]UZD24536.1 hypothetical protein OM944_08540 [Algoriphagus sp. TR-M5]WBL41900.1 hypothetical protein PBT90_14185 [Algoriphagus sp. TR-M9]